MFSSVNLSFNRRSPVVTILIGKELFVWLQKFFKTEPVPFFLFNQQISFVLELNGVTVVDRSCFVRTIDD